MPKVLKTADNRLFLGRTSSGKSTLARHQLQKFNRVMLFDPANDEENEKIPGIVICETPMELVEAFKRKPRGKLWVLWRGYKHYGPDQAGAFEAANRVAWAVGDLVLYWDEVDMMRLPGSNLPPVAYKIANMGRHRGLRIFACARRPAKVPIDIRANSTRICVFKTHEPADVNALADRMGKRAADELSCIRDYHAMDWTELQSSVKKSPFY